MGKGKRERGGGFTLTEPHTLHQRLLPLLRPAADILRLAPDGVVRVVRWPVDQTQGRGLFTTRKLVSAVPIYSNTHLPSTPSPLPPPHHKPPLLPSE